MAELFEAIAPRNYKGRQWGELRRVRMAVHFLQVGIDYFKKKDRRALLRLTREERETFCKEVGIKDPGGES